MSPDHGKSQVHHAADEVDVPPHIGPHVGLIRNVGYTTESAIADLIDNSLSADAKNIEVGFLWQDGDPLVYVLDDGCGMDDATLHEAMRIGSQVLADKRRANDHGKFSVGLKTASFSMGRQLTVITKRAGGQRRQATMDLDDVVDRQKWHYRREVSPEASPWLGKFGTRDQGTLVIIRKVDRLAGEQRLDPESFAALLEETARRLEFIFHCILDGTDPIDAQRRRVAPAVSIVLNGIRPLQGFDAMLYDAPGSDYRAPVQLPGAHGKVRIRWGTLPDPKNLDEQTLEQLTVHGDLHLLDGFYIYRNRRLICSGSWLGMGVRRETGTRLARVVIALPDNTLDKEWGIDVGKSKVSLPKELRGWFREFAGRAQEASRGMLGLRGESKDVRLPGEIQVQPIYAIERTSNGVIVVRINENHPRIQELLKSHESTTRELLTAFEFRIDKEVKQWLNLL